VALGWLNVVAHWLKTRALVPAREQLMITGRKSHLVRLRDKPARAIVGKVQDWLIAELRADATAVGALYPSLNIDIGTSPRAAN
jgi:LysR family transcriptional regulator, glycine cleavage system transcriptional activator